MEGTVHVSELCKSFGSTMVFQRWGRTTRVLESISFDLEKGDFAAVVGESGSGKTTLGRCILGLLPMDSGSAVVNGFNVGRLTKNEEKAFRMSAQMVFQNPYSSLNPAFRARDALLEAVRVHRGDSSKAQALEEVERLAGLVQLSPERLNEYPPQLSGGEKRRVVFARALATNPNFVVTDEPVSGLDQPIQAQLLDLLRKIHQRQKTTMLFISHDLRLVRFIATRVLVMHRGRIVEDAPSELFFGKGPLHPYSRELLESAFNADRRILNERQSPPPERGSGGCSFRNRCGRRSDAFAELCRLETPRLVKIGPAHSVACHLCVKEIQ